jgi:hypothetical protein
MKAIPGGVGLLAISVASAVLQLATLPAAAQQPDGLPRWEYRVLTKEQVIDLGKKDLVAGLNRLGDDGWELAGVDGPYIFKRLKGPDPNYVEQLKSQMTLAEADVENWKDRLAWSERMAKKGYLATNQVQADRMRLQRAEITLDLLRRTMQNLLPAPKEPGEKVHMPKQ